MNKRIAACVVFTFLSWGLHAQNFKKKIITGLDEELTAIQAEWVCIDADTLLDFAVAGNAGGELKLVFYNNDLVKQTTMPTAIESGYIQLADWDRDNKIDVLVSGQSTGNNDGLFVFRNNADFTFTRQTQEIIDHAGQFRIGDLNNDGSPDIIAFGNSFIRIYDHSGTMRFEVTGIAPSDISIFDLNKDGVTDFAVSASSFTAVFIGKGNFIFEKRNAPMPADGLLSLTDLDNDGQFDVIVANKTGSKAWHNEGDTLILDQTLDGIKKLQLFTGDITNDGLSDIITDVTVDSVNLIIQRVGDHDRDDDLDVVQVIDSLGTQWLKLYENTTVTTNHKPEAPSIGYAISTFDKTFIFWEPATDDHTATPTITYDVWLGNDDGNVISPSFDLASGWRTVVHHGNAGTNTSMIVERLTDDRYFYAVQSVDNAYNGSRSFGSGGVMPCFDLVHETVQACKDTEVTLTGGAGATWFSVSKGFVGSSDSFTFVAVAADTLFALVPQAMDCSKNKVFVIHVNEAPPSETETIYACKEQSLELTIPDGWSNIIWDKGPQVITTVDQTVTVTADSHGCTYKKDFLIRISEPIVTIGGDGFQVMKGTSVQLEASGTAEQWQWKPATGLDNPFISNPMATPLITTEYVVTGTDSIGCRSTARTTVLVSENAFVPNLFTPNGDGTNDTLMIYGLSASRKFNFRIFNREGSMVYETKDISQATTVGWNGTVQGVRQPSGIYYWKVDGEASDGGKLLLNGKTTGSILLVH
jgi:gliding motility-associated-like protein